MSRGVAGQRAAGVVLQAVLQATCAAGYPASSPCPGCSALPKADFGLAAQPFAIHRDAGQHRRGLRRPGAGRETAAGVGFVFVPQQRVLAGSGRDHQAAQRPAVDVQSQRAGFVAWSACAASVPIVATCWRHDDRRFRLARWFWAQSVQGRAPGVLAFRIASGPADT